MTIYFYFCSTCVDSINYKVTMNKNLYFPNKVYMVQLQQDACG